jgi:recombinational DNA repair protein (RecF pathway)
MIVRIEGIVLATYPTGDTSEVVRILSPERGRVSLIAKGSRAAKSKVSAALQPFAVVEAHAVVREGSDLGVLREAALVRAHPGLAADLERFSLAALFLELIAECTLADHAIPEGYSLALDGLADLESAPRPSLGTRGAGWLLEALREVGFEPAIAPELLRPWPPGVPRPAAFALRIQEGTVEAAGVASAPRWPCLPPVAARDILLPPEAVRCLYEARGGRTREGLTPLADAHARQLTEALIRLAERHMETPLRAARFWRDLQRG